MGETAPNEPAIPGAAVSPAWKAKAELVEALNHAVGAILLLKQLEYCPNSALHFLVWIENNLVAVVHKPNWYREAQLTLLRLVEFCSVEARARHPARCARSCPIRPSAADSKRSQLGVAEAQNLHAGDLLDLQNNKSLATKWMKWVSYLRGSQRLAGPKCSSTQSCQL